jgi:hypothetical protein
MAADSTTETGLGIVRAPGHGLYSSGSSGGLAPQAKRLARVRVGLAELLEALVFDAAALTIAVGLALMAYGITLMINY